MSPKVTDDRHFQIPRLSLDPDDLTVPGVIVEVDPDDADAAGAFLEDAVNFDDAWDANSELEASR